MADSAPENTPGTLNSPSGFAALDAAAIFGHAPIGLDGPANLAEAVKQNTDNKESAQAQPRSWLDWGFDKALSPFIHNQDTRATVGHYGGEFLKTASLFTGGKLGIAATLITYGLGQASPDT